MGLRFTAATPELIEAEWTVGKHHLQPYGLVHGGVYCGVVETVCSIGAGLAAGARGLGGVVGLENSTSFIRSARLGAVLKARATPLTRGRTTQVWQAEIRDDQGQLIATGRVRTLAVKPD
jgi:uncharacterized protein (TIGR00369 family)